MKMNQKFITTTPLLVFAFCIIAILSSCKSEVPRQNTYTVKFDANGGEGIPPKEILATYDEEFELPENTFTRTDYVFIFWNTQKDGSGINYVPKTNIKNLTTENNATVTLYAQWSKKDNPSNPTNPDTPDNPSTPTNPDTPDNPEPTEPDTPDGEVYVISNNSNLYEPAVAGYEKYQFESVNGTVDTAKLVLAKKMFGDKLADFTETDVKYTLDFSKKSFADIANEIENRNEYASKKGISKSENIITDENLTETIKIGDVEFITKPLYYNGDDDQIIQQAFKFGKNVKNVNVSFGSEHSMTEAYKGGIILENPNITIESNIASTTLNGIMFMDTMKELSENSLVSILTKASNLPVLGVRFGYMDVNNKNLFGSGIDKILGNYYNKNMTNKLSPKIGTDYVFDAKDYLNGGYLYDEEGKYNNNAYELDINTALLIGEWLTETIKNVNITGDMTSGRDTNIDPINVRFSGNVSDLRFTSNSGNGIIDFAKVGPAECQFAGGKIIIRGLENNKTEKIFGATVLDFYNVDKTLLKNVSVETSFVRTVYSNGTFTGTALPGVNFKQGSSASTNRAWERKGRGEDVPESELF